jgi:hypothetical protein
MAAALISWNESNAPVLNFPVMVARIKEATGRDPMNWNEQAHSHFEAWKNAKGYGEFDPQGLHWHSSQKWFHEYKADPEGYRKAPRHCNFAMVLDRWGQEDLSSADVRLCEKINFERFLKRLTLANGYEISDLNERMDNIREMLPNDGSLDDLDKDIFLHNQREALVGQFQLDWAIEITTLVMSWLSPDLKSSELSIQY